MEKARLAVDIGGTFTDLFLDWNGKRSSAKVLTTPRAPEEGVMTGMAEILKQASVAPGDLGIGQLQAEAGDRGPEALAVAQPEPGR